MENFSFFVVRFEPIYSQKSGASYVKKQQYPILFVDVTWFIETKGFYLLQVKKFRDFTDIKQLTRSQLFLFLHCYQITKPASGSCVALQSYVIQKMKFSSNTIKSRIQAQVLCLEKGLFWWAYIRVGLYSREPLFEILRYFLQ